MKQSILKVLPWLITAVALYFAFRGVEWGVLFSHITSADYGLLFIAFCLTITSYLLRSRRWQFLFPRPTLKFIDAARVLFLGFFMNNVLPARTGELVRAHAGAKLAGEKRTLVLATIFSERLADGLTLSLMFVIFAFHAGDAGLSRNLFYVALLFAGVAIFIVAGLFLRESAFGFAERVQTKLGGKASRYALDRLHIFVNGLTPLFSVRKIPFLALWSLLVWGVELLIYVAIAHAFNADLSLASSVLFLVAVNFSSLIPAAPGGIGVIEAVASAALVSIGIDKEQALSMVIAQHAMQYLVVGIPGAAVLLTWRESLKTMQEVDDEQPVKPCVT